MWHEFYNSKVRVAFELLFPNTMPLASALMFMAIFFPFNLQTVEFGLRSSLNSLSLCSYSPKT